MGVKRLRDANIIYLGQLVQLTERDIRFEAGVEISLGMDTQGWIAPHERTISEEEKQRRSKLFDIQVDETDLSLQSLSKLFKANIKYVGQLVEYIGAQLSRIGIYHVGPDHEINEILWHEFGLSLGMETHDWVSPDMRAAKEGETAISEMSPEDVEPSCLCSNVNLTTIVSR